MPRLRGRAGIAQEGPDKGKWLYEVTLWDLAGEVQAGEPWQFGPFDSEDAACERGREIIRSISEALEKEVTGKKSGRYFDLKNGGVMRPWDEQ